MMFSMTARERPLCGKVSGSSRMGREIVVVAFFMKSVSQIEYRRVVEFAGSGKKRALQKFYTWAEKKGEARFQ
jgi:hypothetical protein